MNKSPLTTFLLAGLLISALASVALCYLCTRNAMRLVELQSQVAFAQSRGAFIAALAKEAVDYSAKNPAIDPILEAAGVKPPRTSQLVAPKPAAK
jgi:hypothetical protein